MSTMGASSQLAPFHRSEMPRPSISSSSQASNTAGYSRRSAGTNPSKAVRSASGLRRSHTVGMRSNARKRSTAASSPAAADGGSGSGTGVGLSRAAFATRTTAKTATAAARTMRTTMEPPPWTPGSCRRPTAPPPAASAGGGGDALCCRPLYALRRRLPGYSLSLSSLSLRKNVETLIPSCAAASSALASRASYEAIVSRSTSSSIGLRLRP